MSLARIGIPAIGALVARIIELDGRHDARVGPDEQKVEGELADPVGNARAPFAALETQGLQQLHLTQDGVLWACLHETPIEHLFGFAEQGTLGLEGPGPIESGGAAPGSSSFQDGGDHCRGEKQAERP